MRLVCLSPWWGSSPACISKLLSCTAMTPCGLPVRGCRSRRTTRRRTAHWSARSGWTAGKRTEQCRWVLRREDTLLCMYHVMNGSRLLSISSIQMVTDSRAVLTVWCHGISYFDRVVVVFIVHRSGFSGCTVQSNSKLASGDGPDASDENIKYVRFSGTKGGLSTLPS